MKRVLTYSIIACLLVGLVSCETSDNLMDDIKNESITTPSGNKVILSANIQGSNNTRVALTPDKDANDKAIVKVDWNTSDEEFKVYGMSYEEENYGNYISTTFTQTEGNKFEGTELENCNSLLAIYGNHTMSNNLISYDISQQDGTLNEDYVIMTAGLEDFGEDIYFKHKTSILKTTFKIDDEVVNPQISKIVVGNAYASSSDSKPTNSITVTPTVGSEDIYIFLLRDRGSYAGHTFTFSVTINGANFDTELTIPESAEIEAGKFYTATINLSSVALLPNGEAVRSAIYNLVGRNAGLMDYVVFETESTREGGTLIEGGTDVYIKREKSGIEGSAHWYTLYIYTKRKTMKFHADCSNMFKKHDDETFSSIYSITFPETGIDTSGVENMSGMFLDCNDLVNLNLGGFTTDNATDMCGMFFGCHDIPSIDLSKFNTEKVTDMSLMFADCFKLTALDLSSFNTANVTTMEGMFNFNAHAGSSNESRLKTITFSENFNTGKVKSMANMFSYCIALTELNLSSFDTSNVTDMSGMFDNCRTLTSLNLSQFITTKVTTMTSMFCQCANMRHLYLDKFSVESINKIIENVSTDNGQTTVTTIIYTGLLQMFDGLGSALSGGVKAYIHINWDLYPILGNTYTNIDYDKASFVNAGQSSN